MRYFNRFFLLFTFVVGHAEAQPIPDHASKRLIGSGWECDRGYQRSGNECQPVVIPDNAALDWGIEGRSCGGC